MLAGMCVLQANAIISNQIKRENEHPVLSIPSVQLKHSYTEENSLEAFHFNLALFRSP